MRICIFALNGYHLAAYTIYLLVTLFMRIFIACLTQLFDIARAAFSLRYFRGLGGKIWFGSNSKLCLIAALILLFLGSSQALANTINEELEICFNFSCKDQQIVRLNGTDINRLHKHFNQQIDDAENEREVIKIAIAMMETIVGRTTPTRFDVGRNFPAGQQLESRHGQLDCIDEANNTTTYLELFQRRGWLKHHRVLERAYRRSLFDQHWAGQIEEIATEARFVIDSWFFDNGQPPVIVSEPAWSDLSIF